MTKIIISLIVTCIIYSCQNSKNKIVESINEIKDSIIENDIEQDYNYENEENQRLINFEEAIKSDIIKNLPQNWIELGTDDNNEQVIFNDEWAGQESVKIEIEKNSVNLFVGNDVGGYTLSIKQVEWQVDNDTIWFHGDEKFDGKTSAYTIAFCWIDKNMGTASWTINDRFGIKKFEGVTEEKQSNFKLISHGSLPPENQ